MWPDYSGQSWLAGKKASYTHFVRKSRRFATAHTSSIGSRAGIVEDAGAIAGVDEE